MLDSTWEGEAVIKCKHCGNEKPESEMAVRGGKPSKVCIECKETRGGGEPRKKERPLRGVLVQRRISSSRSRLAASA